MGLIRPEWALSTRSPHAPTWEQIEDQDAWDVKMAVYAAMVDRMDQNIGRVLEKIRQLGKERNTLVLFLSDNGPSDEDRTSTPDIPPGPVESYRTRRSALGESQQHSLSPVQTLESRRGNLDSADRLLARGDQERWQHKPRNQPPDRHHGHRHRDCRRRVPHDL